MSSRRPRCQPEGVLSLNPHTEARYVDVNGVHTYYETTGHGAPVVLLHGGFGGAHLFGALVPAFAERHRVFVVEQRGRGRTADVDGPISYQDLANDMVGFVEQVVEQPSHLVGFSDGGVVGLLVGMQRHDLLDRLVTVGANFHREGLIGAELWTAASPDDDDWAGPRQRYAQVSPDGPDHFPIVFEKLQRMWREEPTLSEDDVARIPIPVLVVVGDDDVIRHQHTVALYEALPRGQLAVIPGASHAVFMEKPSLLSRVVMDFLAEEGDPQTILPVRRSER